jgi:hypothetical protein
MASGHLLARERSVIAVPLSWWIVAKSTTSLLILRLDLSFCKE